MAEVGLVASVLQLAGFGLKLSISLYSFAETVSSADKDVKHIAKDVSLTSAVLNELGENLKKDKRNGIASDNAIKTAREVVHECSEVFREIDTALEKDSVKFSLAKFKWPFQLRRMELLRTNLERLKSTLILMLHVLTYATKMKRSTVKESQAIFERQQIQSLILANQRAVAGFENLSLTAGIPSEPVASADLQNPVSFGQASAEASNSGNLATQSPSEATLPKGHIQMMSSMNAIALFRWLRKSGTIVDDARSACTMLTATSMLPASPDEKKNDRSQRSSDVGLSTPSSDDQSTDFTSKERLSPMTNCKEPIPSVFDGDKMGVDSDEGDTVVHEWDERSLEGRSHQKACDEPNVPLEDAWYERTQGRERHRPRSRGRVGQAGYRTASPVDSEVNRRLRMLEEVKRREKEDARFKYGNEQEFVRLTERDAREAIMLEKEEKRKEEAAKVLRMRATLNMAGYPEGSIERRLGERNRGFTKTGKAPEGIPGAGSYIPIDRRPTYLKIHSNYLSPDTLDVYGLPWEWDDGDWGYIIVKRWLPESDRDILFEHTRRMRTEFRRYRTNSLSRTSARRRGTEPDHETSCSEGSFTDHAGPEPTDMKKQKGADEERMKKEDPLKNYAGPRPAFDIKKPEVIVREPRNQQTFPSSPLFGGQDTESYPDDFDLDACHRSRGTSDKPATTEPAASKEKDDLLLVEEMSPSKQRSRTHNDMKSLGDEVDELLGKWTTLQLNSGASSEPAPKPRRVPWIFT